MEDSLSIASKLIQGTHAGSRDLKKPLKIQFHGEVGVDAGGVTKEFFQLLSEQLFTTKNTYGLWIDAQHHNSSAGLWFNPSSLEKDDSGLMYTLVGLLMGLAVYNGVVLDVHFPRILYKQLLTTAKGKEEGNTPITLSDFSELKPEMVRGWMEMLAWDSSEDSAVESQRGCLMEDVFGLVFEGTYYEIDGSTPITVELIEGGSDIEVTEKNRDKYVHLYMTWYAELLVKKMFQSFSLGFWTVVSGYTLTLFSPSELELLVEGEPTLDFDALEKEGTVYEGYTAEHICVRRFWDVVKELNDKEKRLFLRFVTGASRPPMGGLSKLIPKLKIQRNGCEPTELLPTAATCFNTLLLPEYGTREKMKRKLLVAIENASGFGLE